MPKISKKRAMEKLSFELDRFAESVREVLHWKIDDSIDREEAIGPRAEDIVLAWVQRILLETVADDLGPEAVVRLFESAYFQISGQHIGPRDFNMTHRPLQVELEYVESHFQGDRELKEQFPDLPSLTIPSSKSLRVEAAAKWLYDNDDEIESGGTGVWEDASRSTKELYIKKVRSVLDILIDRKPELSKEKDQ